MSYITLRCCWYGIIILNVHTQTEGKSDDLSDRISEELEHIFGQFLSAT